MEVIKPHAKPVRLFFFWSGIIATFAYRVIIVLNFYSPLWVQIAWYIGTVGFSIYFWHRYDIQTKRARLVDRYDLVNCLDKQQYDSAEQHAALKYIVQTTATSKSRWNSMFIFVLSVLALVVGLVFDFLIVL